MPIFYKQSFIGASVPIHLGVIYDYFLFITAESSPLPKRWVWSTKPKIFIKWSFPKKSY